MRVLDAVMARASLVMDAADVAAGLDTPTPALDDERPLDRIDRGDTRAVLGVLARLENDAFS